MGMQLNKQHQCMGVVLQEAWHQDMASTSKAIWWLCTEDRQELVCLVPIECHTTAVNGGPSKSIQVLRPNSTYITTCMLGISELSRCTAAVDFG